MKQRDTSCLNQWYVSLLLLFTLSATAQESSMRVDYLTIDDGLRDHRIQDIITDQEGFIWIATSVAVHKYDGELIVPVLNNDNNFVIQVNEKRNLFITDYSHVLITHPERQDRPLRTNIPGTGGRSPFLVDDPGNIWLGNEQGRFFHFRYTNDTIILVSEFKSATETQSPGAIHNLLREDPGRIWVAGKNGLFFFDPGKDTVLTPCSLRGPESRQPQPAVYCMHFDKKRNLWMGTSEGLCLVSPAEMTHTRETFFLTDKMSRFFPAFKKLDKEVVYTICSDRDGRFFLRTGKGIYSTNRSKSKLDLLIKEDLQSYRSFYGFSEYALQYTQDGILLFGTDRGIGKINMNQKSFSILKHDPADPESLSTNKLCQVLKDRKGNLWVGTVGNGLNKGIPEGDGYRFEHFVHDPDNPFSLHSDEVTHLFMDHEGTVWVGAWSLQRIDESTGQVRFVYPDFIKNFPFDLSHVNVVYIEEDIRSNLFFCISDISLLYDRESRRLDWFYLDRNKSYSNYMKIFVTLDGRQFCSSYPLGIYEIKYPLVRIDSFSVCPEGSDLLYKDDKLFADYYFDMELFEEDGFKDIWTPTFLNFRLTYDEDNKASMVLHHAYTEADGIPYDYYDEMIEHNDQLWATTIKGLACIDRKKKSICNFYSEDGLPTNFFYYGRFKDESGKLYFCTTDGLLFFYPDSVTMPEPPEVRLRSVSIHRKIRLSRKEGISRDSVQTEVVSEIPAGGLRLNYFQNSFTIDYVALDFVNSNGTKYQWNLHDKKRNSDIRGYARQAAFVNLRRGRYIFSVTAANHNNVWNTTGASLDIRILPPPWFRWYAWLVYGLLLLLLLMAYRRFLVRRASLHTALEVERIEKEKVLELDHMKSRFFANISHEFRTPLTLILGPVEDLFKNKAESPKLTDDTLRMIRRNIKRLQRLINQLLDVARLETGNMRLNIAPDDLSGFCHTLSQSFLSLAESKNIEYVFNLEETPDPVCFDSDKVEKILSNLLSNAFKFTPEGGTIRVELTYPEKKEDGKPKKALLVVSDSGKGIPPPQQEKIFERFYQVNPSDTREAEGTGIGLSLTRELVELCHGEIKVESKPGKGSRFEVLLPVSADQFSPDEIVSEPERKEPEEAIMANELQPDETGHMIETPREELKDHDNLKPLVLLVEDNPDLRKYIRGHLAGTCRLEEAENGSMGLDLARELIPDLVITDLMMPVMDGMEMSRILKSDERTSHIPIIMLTAKADRESKLKGLTQGADDYLIKPFDAEELKVRVRNLIQQRQVLREKFRKEYFSVKPGEEQKPYDDRLMQKLIAVFEQHINDSEFNVEQLADELSLSRTQLFRKVHALTGNSPKDLMRNMRLRTAARLFSSGHDQVTQVMLQVGFNSSSWFARSFRELYGVTPTEYIKNNAHV